MQCCKPMSGFHHSPACKDFEPFLPVQDAERELHQLLQCMREEGVQQEVEDDWLLALAEAAGPDSQRRLSSSQQVPPAASEGMLCDHCPLCIAPGRALLFEKCHAARAAAATFPPVQP